jgi:hypothetical protein
MSWIDYQRNHTEFIECLEQNITEPEEEQIYWSSRPSVGHIFKETLKEIVRKAWIKIKFDYSIDHPELLHKYIPLITEEIQPIAISKEYSPIMMNNRTKWKTQEQYFHNFKFRWRRKTTIYTSIKDEIIKYTQKQFVYNPYLEHLQYYKFSVSKPNLIKIVVFNYNPHSLLVQAFSKKGILEEKTKDKGKICLTEKAKTLNLFYKYAGADGFPCNKMQKELLFFRKIFKIYQKYSNGSEACTQF